MRILPAALIFLGATAAAFAAPQNPGLLSAEELFRASPIRNASLSPDGRHLGMIVAQDDGTRGIVIYDLKTHATTGLRGGELFDLWSFSWIGDDRLVFSIARDRMYPSGLYSARIDDIADYTAIDTFDDPQVLDVPQARPGRVLVWYTGTSGPVTAMFMPGTLAEMDAVHIRPGMIQQGRGDAVVRRYPPPGDGAVESWHTDAKGEPALCVVWANGGRHTYRYHLPTDSWSEVPIDNATTRLIGMDADDAHAWAVRYTNGRGFELARCSLADGSLEAPVLTEPDYALWDGRPIWSRMDHHLMGLVYLRRHATTFWLDKSGAEAQAMIDKLRTGTENVMIDSDLSGRKILFARTGARFPGAIDLIDLDAKTIVNVGEVGPWLKGRPLHAIKPINFMSRDGVKIEGYVSLPDGVSAAHPVPLVVIPHGGPAARNSGEYDPVVQFLVSRGYAVIEPDYRSSTGYGPSVSGDHMFDFTVMNNDITDATRAFLRSGLVDPRRVAIFGGSFGGYLAISGVEREKGLYCCAVSECGVFDWKSQVTSVEKHAAPGYYKRYLDYIGHPDGNLDALARENLLDRVDEIGVPVLIAHGDDDGIVDVAQSKRLVRALKSRGLPHETFFRRYEGHGFFDYQDRVDFYHRVEAFLAKNLGGATLTPAD
jgi:dipeptidyl aminopeptidase/acylaminoacyl peptidase